MEDQDIKNLFAKSKNVELSPREQLLAKASVLKFMENNPFRPRPWVLFASFGSLRPALKYGTVSLASLLLVVFFGAGVSVAANGALPGDLLYPVKTQLTEKLVRLAISSESAKAKYDISLVRKRLQEAETVSVQRSLDAAASAKVQALVNAHIRNAKKSIEKEGKRDKAMNTSVELQASLDAHVKALDDLSEKKGYRNDEGIRSLILDVKSQAAQLRIDALEQTEVGGTIDADVNVTE